MDREIDRKNKRLVVRILIIGGVIIVISIVSFWILLPPKQSHISAKNNLISNQTGTIDGYDPASDSIIDPINLWLNYETRVYAGRVRHGEKINIIKRVGDGVLIEKENGKRGWLTYFFIKELK